MMIELSHTTFTLLLEIGMYEMKRKDIALTYALAMRSSANTDWAAVNEAIIERWSRSGLEYIKRLAHSGKCFE